LRPNKSLELSGVNRTGAIQLHSCGQIQVLNPTRLKTVFSEAFNEQNTLLFQTHSTDQEIGGLRTEITV